MCEGSGLRCGCCSEALVGWQCDSRALWRLWHVSKHEGRRQQPAWPVSPPAPGTLSCACWPVWPYCYAFRVRGGCLYTAQQGCGCCVHTASVRAPQLQAKGPEDTPALSLLSPFPLPFSMSQMAILLTTSKKALHSTAHMCPGMFVDLSESQPCPRLKSCSL